MASLQFDQSVSYSSIAPIAQGPGAVTHDSGGQTYTYSIDADAGALVVRDLSNLGGSVQRITLPGSYSSVGQPHLEVGLIDGGQKLLVSSPPEGRVLIYEIGSNGRLNGPDSVTLGSEAVTSIAVAPGIGLVVADALGDLTLWTKDGGGIYSPGPSVEVGFRVVQSDVRQVEVISHGSASYAVALSSDDVSISSFRINLDGSLTQVQELHTSDGMSASGIHAMAQTSLDGEKYVLVAGSGSSSVTVIQLRDDGFLIPVDQVNDTLETGFDDITQLETFSLGERVFVLAAGGDQGVTLMTMLPGGRLVHLDTLTSDPGGTLDDIAEMTLSHRGGVLQINAIREDGSGSALYTYDVSQIEETIFQAGSSGSATGNATHDLLIAHSSDSVLRGNGGDDILVDGSGLDDLYGGDGADVFILTADGNTDTIHDFELGIDRIDMSSAGRIFTLDALELTAQSYGFSVSFSNETLIVRTDDGQSINPGSLSIEDLVDPLWHVSVVASEEVPIEIVGSSADDRLVGGSKQDKFFGGGGSDQIFGFEGDDFIHGGQIDPENDALHGQVFRLYQATLGRAPDDAGLLYWASLMRSGAANLDSVTRGFTGSQEFLTAYGGLDDGGFVTLLYRNVLGRDPDAAGFQGWTNLLTAETLTRQQVVVGFSESAEFQNSTSQDGLQYSFEALVSRLSDEVFRLYQATLGRAPDEAGFVHWTTSLASGLDFDDAINGFVNSSEFVGRYGSTSNEDFVTLLYSNVLDRAPDAAGLASWLNHLAGGADRADVVQGFANSAEFVRNTKDDVAEYLAGIENSDKLVSGSGDDVLFGGFGADTFVFSPSDNGQTTITDFESWDRIDLTSFNFSSATEAIGYASVVGRDVVFDFGDVDIQLNRANIADVEDALLI